jgi:hypothetical protein
MRKVTNKTMLHEFLSLRVRAAEAKTPEELVYIGHNISLLCLLDKDNGYNWPLWKEQHMSTIAGNIEYYSSKVQEEQRMEDFLFFCNNGYYPTEEVSFKCLDINYD